MQSKKETDEIFVGQNCLVNPKEKKAMKISVT